MKNLAIKKLYYSISEVSSLTSIKPYVLRYWETEFKKLKPSKNQAGKRIYRRHDVEIVLLIKKLLYTDKFTIDGARQQLNTPNRQIVADDSFKHKRVELIEELKEELQEIVDLIDS